MTAALLLLAWGCGASPEGETGGPLVDTADTADTAPPSTEVDPCITELMPGGSVDEDRDCTDGRCLVPAGTSWQGAADPLHPERCPLHEVELSAFRIDRTEVTIGAWEACVAAGDCAPQPTWCAPASDHEARDQLPVVCIDWQQASDYCTRQGGRLPTEAEWEKAARGSDGAEWPWGPQSPSCNYANFRFVSSYCDGEPAPVGSRVNGRSPFGLYDVAGNTWEWVADWYDAGRYRDGVTVDPGSPEQCRDQVDDEPGPCDQRVMRGGAWNTTEDTLHPAARTAAPPALVDLNVGFRCAWDG